MLICILPLVLLGLEELSYKLNSQPVIGYIDPRSLSMDHGEISRSRRVILLLRWTRMAQLAALGVVFAMVAASSELHTFYTRSGQLAGLALLLQLVRMVSGKVVDQWSVLRVVASMQAVVLIVLALVGPGSVIDGEIPFNSVDWLMSLMAFLELFILSVSLAFCCTYFLRLASREGSSLYYSLPPLAFSEYWVCRLLRVAAVMATIALLAHSLLFTLAGYPLGPTPLQALLLGIMLTAMTRLRDADRLHHPVAMILTSLAWVLNIAFTLAGLTEASRNWL